MSEFRDKPTAVLLVEALRLSHENPEAAERWECLYELHRRNEEDIFATASIWCVSDDAVARKLAADILAQLGPLTQEGAEQLRPFTKRSDPLMQTLLDDADAAVVAAAVSFFEQHYVSGPIVARPALASHHSFEVRLAVARCIGAELGGPKTDTAIELLVKLSNDTQESVRDWATFGLGQCQLDKDVIREALFRRLDDPHFDTRSEAMVGLAMRGDERAIPFVTAALQAEFVGKLAVEAAGILGSPVFTELLEEIRSWWDVDPKLLESALQSCRREGSLADYRHSRDERA
jgi:HEAT repeat protein